MSESEAWNQRRWGGGLIGYRAWPPPARTQHRTNGKAPPPSTDGGCWPWSRLMQHRIDGEAPPHPADGSGWPDERRAHRDGRWRGRA